MLQHLLDTHAVVVVLEGQCLSFSAHPLQLSAGLPLICPHTIIQRIANGIVGDGLAIVAGQLVLPITVTIRIRDSLLRTAQRTGGVGILHLTGDVAATVVVVHPGRIFMRIIHPNQLAQRIIGVGRSQTATLLRDDVAAAIVGVLEGTTSGNE